MTDAEPKVRVRCPHCNGLARVRPEIADRALTCPRCGKQGVFRRVGAQEPEPKAGAPRDTSAQPARRPPRGVRPLAAAGVGLVAFIAGIVLGALLVSHPSAHMREAQAPAAQTSEPLSDVQQQALNFHRSLSAAQQEALDLRRSLSAYSVVLTPGEIYRTKCEVALMPTHRDVVEQALPAAALAITSGKVDLPAGTEVKVLGFRLMESDFGYNSLWYNFAVEEQFATGMQAMDAKGTVHTVGWVWTLMTVEDPMADYEWVGSAAFKNLEPLLQPHKDLVAEVFSVRFQQELEAQGIDLRMVE